MAACIMTFAWMAMVILIAVAIVHFVRVLGERAKMKVAPTEEQRRSIHGEVHSLAKTLSYVLCSLVVVALLTFILIITLIADLAWNNGGSSQLLEDARFATVIIMIVGAVCSLVLLGMRPWRPYEETVWHLRDETTTEVAHEAEEVNGQEKPASV